MEVQKIVSKKIIKLIELRERVFEKYFETKNEDFLMIIKEIAEVEKNLLDQESKYLTEIISKIENDKEQLQNGPKGGVITSAKFEDLDRGFHGGQLGL